MSRLGSFFAVRKNWPQRNCGKTWSECVRVGGTENLNLTSVERALDLLDKIHAWTVQ